MHVRRTLSVALAAGALALSGCAGDDLSSDGGGEGDGGGGASGPVTISGQNFPEAELVATMYAQLLEEEGFEPDVKLVDTRDVYMQTFPDDVDVVPEYVGGIVDFLNTTANGADAESMTTSDAQESLDNAADLLEERGITMLEPSEATDTNAYFVTQEYADSEGVSTLSDLEGTSVVLAAAPDCEGRQDCEAGLRQVYGIDITKLLPLGFASDQTYQAVLDGEAQLGQTSTTDGSLDSQGLVLLEDDQEIQPAQNLVPAVSTAFLEENGEVAGPLNDLMGALTTENLTELNGRVSVDREPVEDVARSFLEDQGLL
jgi:osmoprotectant transport system substrate-binding protein